MTSKPRGVSGDFLMGGERLLKIDRQPRLSGLHVRSKSAINPELVATERNRLGRR